MPTDGINQVFALVDARDADGFAALFAPDGRFTFDRPGRPTDLGRRDGTVVRHLIGEPRVTRRSIR